MDERESPPGRLVHGARSNVLKRLDVQRIQRQVRQQNGIARVRDLTGTQRRYLYLYSEALRLVQRLEPIGADGQANSSMASYLAAVNTAGRALERFEASLGHSQKQRDQRDTLTALQQYQRRPS